MVLPWTRPRFLQSGSLGTSRLILILSAEGMIGVEEQEIRELTEAIRVINNRFFILCRVSKSNFSVKFKLDLSKKTGRNRSYMLRKFFIVAFLMACGCTYDHELGSAKNPIKLFLIPGQDPVVLEDNGKKVAEYLSKKTNLQFDVKVPPSYIAVVEAFGSNKADVAVMNTFGYILAHEKYGAEAHLMGTHFGQTSYQGQIITRKGHLKKLEDIDGKKFAYVDPASASGFLQPTELFRKKNIKPKESVFGGKHDTVITMVYQRQVDAGATFYSPETNGKPQDARKLVLTQFPDVFEKISILALTDPIPNDPIVFRKDLPMALKSKVQASLVEYLKTEDGKDTFMKLYNMNDVMPVTDEHYDEVRKSLQRLGKTAQEFIKK